MRKPEFILLFCGCMMIAILKATGQPADSSFSFLYDTIPDSTLTMATAGIDSAIQDSAAITLAESLPALIDSTGTGSDSLPLPDAPVTDTLVVAVGALEVKKAESRETKTPPVRQPEKPNQKPPEKKTLSRTVEPGPPAEKPDTLSRLMVPDSIPPDSVSPAVKKTKQTDAGKVPPIGQLFSGKKFFWALVFFVIGFLGIRFVGKIMGLIAEKSTRFRLTIKGLIPVVRILGWIIIVFIIIQGVFKPSMQALFALGASVGVAVGFAAQDILKNIFGGITVIVDKPFQVGDKIQIEDQYGEVIHIGFRSTRIVTADDSVVTIPNAEIVSKMVSNSNSGETNCQVVAEIFLPIDVDTTLVREIALEAARTSGFVYLKKPISVLFMNVISDRYPYLKMRLKAYVLDIRYEFVFKSEMTEIVIKELLDRKIISRSDYQIK